MSRNYGIEIEIDDLTDEEWTKISNQLKEENTHWEWDYDGEAITGEGCLFGGEGEEEFSDKIADLIFPIIKRAGIDITMRYLDNPPPEENYTYGQEEYDLWVAENEKNNKEEKGK